MRGDNIFPVFRRVDERRSKPILTGSHEVIPRIIQLGRHAKVFRPVNFEGLKN
jgi:hypothetical protein